MGQLVLFSRFISVFYNPRHVYKKGDKFVFCRISFTASLFHSPHDNILKSGRPFDVAYLYTKMVMKK